MANLEIQTTTQNNTLIKIILFLLLFYREAKTNILVFAILTFVIVLRKKQNTLSFTFQTRKQHVHTFHRKKKAVCCEPSPSQGAPPSLTFFANNPRTFEESPQVLPTPHLPANIQARVSWGITASNCLLLHLTWSSPSSHKKPMGNFPSTSSSTAWKPQHLRNRGPVITWMLSPSATCGCSAKSRHVSRTALLGQAEDQQDNPKGHPTGLPWAKKREFKLWSLHITQACTWRSPVVDYPSSSSALCSYSPIAQQQPTISASPYRHTSPAIYFLSL